MNIIAIKQNVVKIHIIIQSKSLNLTINFQCKKTIKLRMKMLKRLSLI